PQVDDLRVAEDGVEWRTEFVTHRRQKLALAAVGYLGFLKRSLRSLASLNRVVESDVPLSLGEFAGGDVGVCPYPLLYLTGCVEDRNSTREHLTVFAAGSPHTVRSEERRVGKECRGGGVGW